MIRHILATAVATAVAVSLSAAAPGGSASEPEQQWRSYWVDAFHEGIYRPSQVEELVAEAVKVNANALIVQTVRRYDCFCNRAAYPRTDAAIAPEPYDPLQAVVDAAHAEGLQVHAWVNVATLWSSSTPPSSADHVYNQHGPSATGHDRWLNKRHDGAEAIGSSTFIDPANPDAVDYIVDGVQSILREYDVDGINLDYIRYPDHNSSASYSDWGYSEASLDRFRAATGRTGTPAPDDPEFSDWRRDQVTNLVRRIYLGMWAVDPQARLSMDGITYGHGPQVVGGWEKTRTYAQVLQDWKGWLDEGIMDTVVAMNYKRQWDADQADMYAEWTEAVADYQGSRQNVVGPALYLNEIRDSLEQAKLAVSQTDAGNTAAGWSGYSYATPSLSAGEGWADPDEERDRLARALTRKGTGPFADDAVVPTMPWKAAPTDGHLTGQVTTRIGRALDQVAVILRPLDGQGEIRDLRTDGSGWFGSAHLPEGRYLVGVAPTQWTAHIPMRVVRVTAGAITSTQLSVP